MEQDLRKPSEDKYSDWNQAWENHALEGEKINVRHMGACIFGENDESSWMWIFQTEDMKWGYAVAWCDYTGWDCQSGGSWKIGFATPFEAVEAMPETTEKDKHVLLMQISGEAPYALSKQE